ncbi:proline-rich protein 36-like [Cavia porcellus]|uniref:proline-rich protein 36-like n=1 Tax=Cavia porcellus TaxID=10141 RepID=UPI002FDF3847
MWIREEKWLNTLNFLTGAAINEKNNTKHKPTSSSLPSPTSSKRRSTSERTSRVLGTHSGENRIATPRPARKPEQSVSRAEPAATRTLPQVRSRAAALPAPRGSPEAAGTANGKGPAAHDPGGSPRLAGLPLCARPALCSRPPRSRRARPPRALGPPQLPLKRRSVPSGGLGTGRDPPHPTPAPWSRPLQDPPPAGPSGSLAPPRAPLERADCAPAVPFRAASVAAFVSWLPRGPHVRQREGPWQGAAWRFYSALLRPCSSDPDGNLAARGRRGASETSRAGLRASPQRAGSAAACRWSLAARAQGGAAGGAWRASLSAWLGPRRLCLWGRWSARLPAAEGPGMKAPVGAPFSASPPRGPSSHVLRKPSFGRARAEASPRSLEMNPRPPNFAALDRGTGDPSTGDTGPPTHPTAQTRFASQPLLEIDLPAVHTLLCHPRHAQLSRTHVLPQRGFTREPPLPGSAMLAAQKPAAASGQQRRRRRRRQRQQLFPMLSSKV